MSQGCSLQTLKQGKISFEQRKFDVCLAWEFRVRRGRLALNCASSLVHSLKDCALLAEFSKLGETQVVKLQSREERAELVIVTVPSRIATRIGLTCAWVQLTTHRAQLSPERPIEEFLSYFPSP